MGWRWMRLASCAMALAPATAWGDDVAPDSPVAAERVVEEIVVRARRRDEPVLEVPGFVTALSEDDLHHANVTRLDDVQPLVPNLQFMNQQAGISPAIRLRGIGTPSPSISVDPGVGVYVDGVYVSRSVGSLLDMLDVERVEVLHGPQGTLFGKNTVGGAINVTTAKPSPRPEAFAMIRPSSFDTVEGRVMVNAPIGAGALADRLFARVAYLGRKSDGYVRNTTLGRDLSDRETNAVLGSLRYLPWDDVSIDVTGTWARERSGARGFRCVPVRRAPLAPAGLLGSCVQAEPYRVQSDVAQLTDVESYGTWGTVTWSPGGMGLLDDVEVKSITAWREQRPRVRQDFDFTGVPLATISSAGGPNPLDGAPGYQRQVSQELQLNLDTLADRLHVVTGAFGYWEEGTENRVLDTLLDVENDVQIDNRDLALFGQATLDVTTWLEVTGGLRYSEERKRLGRIVRNPATPAAPPQSSEDRGATFDAWTPMASLALHVPPAWLSRTPFGGVTTYFTYAEGYKGGGFTGELSPFTAPLSRFEPETAESYEVGVKADAFEGRAALSVALFHADYRDLQVTTQQDTGGFLPVTVTQNAAKATIEGMEAELRAEPIDGLRSRASLGLLDARYDEYLGISQFDGTPRDRAGEALPVSPDLQAHVSLEYDVPIDWVGPRLRGVLTPRIEWYYQSEIFYFGPEVPALTQRGYNLLHARLGYALADGQIEVAVWSRNLTDEAYFDNAFSIGSTFGVAGQAYAAPRSVGGEITLRF